MTDYTTLMEIVSCSNKSEYSIPPNITKSLTNTKAKEDMAFWLKLLWSVLFVLMLVVAVGGNSIVMWIVLAHRRMRTVTNYFLVNLSIADLMMSIFNCTFNFTYMINSNWQFGESYCKVNNYIGIVVVAASVFTLTGISVDRYIAIVRPLKPRTTRRCARIVLGIIWSASLLLGLPSFIYSTTKVYSWRNETIIHCILNWPDGLPMDSTYDYLYNVIIFILTYIIPMSAMILCYSAMGKALWGSKAIGELTQRQQDSIQSKKKVVKMFIVVVIIFAVCWFPYHSYFIYIHHHKQKILYSWYIQHLYLGFYFLAMSNAMVNPIIYYWMNARFRQYFNNIIFGWRCIRRSINDEDGTDTPTNMKFHYNHSVSRSRSDTAEDYSEPYDRYRQNFRHRHNYTSVRRHLTNTESPRSLNEMDRSMRSVHAQTRQSDIPCHHCQPQRSDMNKCSLQVDQVPKSYFYTRHKTHSDPPFRNLENVRSLTSSTAV
nr:PREDICTED: tachykinin-like peptides receptor 86C isoform X1 [Bemisia tabaci]